MIDSFIYFNKLLWTIDHLANNCFGDTDNIFRQTMDNKFVYLLFLFFLFQIKHFICDFSLQGRYMLGKFKPFPFYILPLMAHSFVQTFGTAIVLHVAGVPILAVIKLSVVDGVSHFIIDRIKASQKLLGRWKPDQPLFWWALGFDQFLHNTIYILLIFLVIYSDLV